MPGLTPSLLITRPLPVGRSFADTLPQSVLGRVRLCFSPLLEITPLTDEIEFQAATAVVFSSANGVQVSSRLSKRRDLRAYCIGRRTTESATKAGWNAEFLGENADQLVEKVVQKGLRGPLLHLSGEHVRGDIASRLTEAGCPTMRQPVYAQELVPLTREAQLLLDSQEPVVAPVFSPRTARHFVGQCSPDAKVQFVALGPAVAEPLYALKNSTVFLSDSLDAKGVSKVVEKCVNRLCRVESSGGAQ